jgi:very-short-patch-repair endonuclease
MRGPSRTRARIERRLRQQSTDAEMVLWFSIRDRRLSGLSLLDGSNTIVHRRLCLPRKELIIEVDGGQHSENAKDRERDEILSVLGYRVLRFWNSDVLKNMNGVLEVILEALNN